MTAITTLKIPLLEETINGGFTPRILIVDDEPHYLESVCDIFSEYQSETVIADGGLKALNILKNEHFDLLLLDLDMPDLDGFAIMDFIQKHALDIDVIVLSGMAKADTAMHAYTQRAYRFLKKPYSPEELLYDVRNVLGKRLLEVKNRTMSLQLKYSEQLYRSLIEQVPDIICILNENGQITFINESVSTLLDYQPDELALQHYTTLIHPDDLAHAQSAFDSNNKSPSQIELRLSTKGKERHPSFSLTLTNLSFRISPTHEVKGTHVIARDISENKRAEEIISFHAHYDALTGLPNRTLFNEKLNFELQNAQKYEVGLTVLFIDLDRFKLINDTLGHIKGDMVLQQVASRLKEIARYSDIVARLGSDEFVLGIPGLSDETRAQAIARRCLDALNAPFDIDDNVIPTISASIGIAIYPQNGDSVEELVGNADIAMSQMKSQGKNGIVFYNHSMAQASHIRLTQGNALRRALERNELEMYYQPKVDITTGEIVGAEALMRWHQPERGLLSAGEFLPLAEENGLILPLTDWMLETVCHDIERSRILKNRQIPISINLSPQYLDRCDCPKKMKTAFTRHNIQAELIEVEITENICIRNPASAIAQLNELSKIGVRIAIDDFGTGYSSLAYLHRFPIQTIKVDRSFVSGINDTTGDFPVVLAIISIAQGLNMTLIAEGVETEIQAEYLKKWGCNIMQGYLYHRPMPLNKLWDVLL